MTLAVDDSIAMLNEVGRLCEDLIRVSRPSIAALDRLYR